MNRRHVVLLVAVVSLLSSATATAQAPPVPMQEGSPVAVSISLRPLPQPPHPGKVAVALLEYGLLRTAVLDCGGQFDRQLWLALVWVRFAVFYQNLALQYIQGTVRPAVMTMTADVAGSLLGEAALQPTLWRRFHADTDPEFAAPTIVVELIARVLIRLVQRHLVVHRLDWDRPLRRALNEMRLLPLRWRGRRQLVRAVSRRALPRVRTLPRDFVDLHLDTARFVYWNRVTGPIAQQLFPVDATWLDASITVLALVWFGYALHATLIGWRSWDSIHIWIYQLSRQGITIKKLLGDIVVLVYCGVKLLPYLFAVVRYLFHH